MGRINQQHHTGCIAHVPIRLRFHAIPSVPSGQHAENPALGGHWPGGFFVNLRKRQRHHNRLHPQRRWLSEHGCVHADWLCSVGLYLHWRHFLTGYSSAQLQRRNTCHPRWRDLYVRNGRLHTGDGQPIRLVVLHIECRQLHRHSDSQQPDGYACDGLRSRWSHNQQRG